MRRKEKQITDQTELKSILKGNPICRLGLIDHNLPYVIPISYGYENNALYFHSAREGRKIDIIRENPFVCFEISQDIAIIEAEHACHFSTQFRSIIGNGKIEIIDEKAEKIRGLDIIMQQQRPGPQKWQYLEQALEKILVLKLAISDLSGKKSGF